MYNNQTPINYVNITNYYFLDPRYLRNYHNNYFQNYYDNVNQDIPMQKRIYHLIDVPIKSKVVRTILKSGGEITLHHSKSTHVLFPNKNLVYSKNNLKLSKFFQKTGKKIQTISDLRDEGIFKKKKRNSIGKRLKIPKTIWKENIGLVSHEQFSFSNITENKNIKKINTDKYANILIRFFKFVKFQKTKKKLFEKKELDFNQKVLIKTKINTQTNMKNSYANMLKKKPLIMKNNNIQPTEKKIISLFVNKIIKSTGKFSTVNWISGSCLSQIDDKTIRMKKYIDISGGIVKFFLRNSDFFTLYKYDKSKSKNLSWETKYRKYINETFVLIKGSNPEIEILEWWNNFINVNFKVTNYEDSFPSLDNSNNELELLKKSINLYNQS
jgi:hypothetical protein